MIPVVSQIVPRFAYRVRFAVATDVGRVRSRNEDATLVAPEIGLFCVADGMGGHAAGDVAARVALEEIEECLRGRSAQRALDAYAASADLAARRAVFSRLRDAVERANARVREEAAAKSDRTGMGTTVDVLWLARDHAFLAHAGDGRSYLARSSATLQLTQDHAQLESLKASGALRPRSKSRGANRLLNAVGLHDSITVDTLYVDLAQGDRVLLCSDGVHGQVGTESDLADLLTTGTPDAAARRLVDRAGEVGRDNATALVVEIGERFVRRAGGDRGVRAQDLERAGQSSLFFGLEAPQVMAALVAAVEVEYDVGAEIPRVVTSDLVAYVVLEGSLKYPAGREVGAGALVFGPSLVGVAGEGGLPTVQTPVRMLRLRADDFSEVCAADSELAAALFRRLAEHFARRL